MFRFFATFLKKGSAKNFPTGKILGVFKKSTLDRDLFSVERFTFILSGYEVTNLIPQSLSLAVGTADPF